ncbi:MAG TPA: response regulator transcription factor [Chthoniobacteraceae bacterium]|nr:response regulator transcription factor [Chthoniobacteraceae bacterium]
MNESPGAASRILRAEHSPSSRILLAEDHRPTRDALRTILEQKGYSVTTVDNGDDAIAALSDLDGPTIGIIDWMMPGATGIEVCRAIREASPGRFIYLIVVTARDGEEDVAKALAAGADDFIRKPCGPSELVARVRNGQRTVDLKRSLTARVGELEEMVERIHRLKQLLPICMYCKKVRDDSDYWREIDEYIHQQTGTDFSHGVCPECMDAALSGNFGTRGLSSD